MPMGSTLTLSICALLLPFRLFAQEWILDPAFADAGRLIVDVNQSIDEVSAIAVRSDGKTLIAGWATPNNLDFSGAIVARIDPDGEMDEDFGQLGIASTFLTDRSLFANAMAQQADDAVVLAGGSLNTEFERDAIVIRYLPDGTQDPDLGVDGMVTLDLGGNEVYTAIAVNSLGQIICAGRVGGSLFVTRHSAQGELDPVFGIGGVSEIPLGFGTLSSHVGMGLRSDGKIALVCMALGDIVLVRLEADGTPDAAFGEEGVLIVEEEFSFHTCLLQPDDFMLLGGGAPLDVNEQCQGFQLMRFDPDGVLDPALDGDGIARTLVSDGCPELFGLSLLPDGRILATGTGSSPETFADLTAVRYLPDGALDLSFDGDGIVMFDMGCEAMDVAYVIAEQTDGDVMVGGLTDCGAFPNDIAVMRIQPEINTSVSGVMASVPSLSMQPNPAHHETWLEYSLPADRSVSLDLWDAQGRMVNALFAGSQQVSGTYRQRIPLDGLSAGLYTAVLSIDGVPHRARIVKE